MDFLSNWMKLPQEERMKHIDLSSPCHLHHSRNYRRQTARYYVLLNHELVNDVLDWQEGDHINLCHCCGENSSRQYCNNPKHIYLGTHRENQRDKSLEARQAGGRVSKGRQFTSEECRKGGRKGGVNTSKKYGVSIIDGYIGKRIGLPTRIKRSLGIPHHERFTGSAKYILDITKEEYEILLPLTPLQRLMSLEMK